MKHMLNIAALTLFLIWGCGPSNYITSSWKAANIQAKKYNKIVVLGLIRDADRTVREKMEQHIVGDLKDVGYAAVCSCDEYNPKAFEGLTEKDAIAKLSNSGVDGVLTITLLDKEKERQYVPGGMMYSTDYVRHYSFYEYYRCMNERIYSRGYYVTNTRYFWESNFYELETNSLLYSAQSQSFDPASAESLSHEYGKMIVNDIVKNNVITNKKTSVLKSM